MRYFLFLVARASALLFATISARDNSLFVHGRGVCMEMEPMMIATRPLKGDTWLQLDIAAQLHAFAAEVIFRSTKNWTRLLRAVLGLKPPTRRGGKQRRRRLLYAAGSHWLVLTAKILDCDALAAQCGLTTGLRLLG